VQVPTTALLWRPGRGAMSFDLVVPKFTTLILVGAHFYGAYAWGNTGEVMLR
jgi:hypothetical protein